MGSRIVIYSPDEHIRYNLHTLDNWGVGGGITARIRLAHALASQGHLVELYVNTPYETTIDGVRYSHHTKFRQATADVFIASTSGDRYDLSHLNEFRLTAGLRILMVHGRIAPKGVNRLEFDSYFGPSNFIRDRIVKAWGVSAEKVFISPRGVVRSFFTPKFAVPDRDDYSLSYSGHTSKGLEAALGILKCLRTYDSRFTLHVFGGSQLWGDVEIPPHKEPGLEYYGLLGQRQLAQELLRCSFSLNLQAIEDSFGMSIIEAMQAGSVVVASPLGAYPEILNHGVNGFLVSGAPNDPVLHRQVGKLIRDLVIDETRIGAIRRNAALKPLDWSVIASSLAHYWEWRLYGTSLNEDVCVICKGTALVLPDGVHCTVCGHYAGSQRMSEPHNGQVHVS